MLAAPHVLSLLFPVISFANSRTCKLCYHYYCVVMCDFSPKQEHLISNIIRTHIFLLIPLMVSLSFAFQAFMVLLVFWFVSFLLFQRFQLISLYMMFQS